MIIVVFDLGPGDGGKGGVVHKLANHHHAHTIIKVGGAQGSHGVNTGKHTFAFSQWGCGTFEGIRTHLTPNIIISPEGLLNEADALQEFGGHLSDPFQLLTCDERAICATPYHGISSRLKELSRGKNQRGTIGSGIGEAYRCSFSEPDLTIYAKDLQSDLLYKKLLKVRDLFMSELRTYDSKSFLLEDRKIAQEDIDLLYDHGFLEYNVERFKHAGKKLRLTDNTYLKKTIFDAGHNAIVESSHGILTDNYYGFWPHVSAIRTLPSFAHTMLIEAGYSDNITTIGVHRAYSVRHGAGPMPTTDDDMTKNLLPGSCKEQNRYQGAIRVGPLDFVLLRYAVEACGPTIDSIALTWFDQIVKNGCWKICDEYQPHSNDFFNYFRSPSRINLFDDNQSDLQLREYQSQLCKQLNNVKPIISSIDVPNSIEEQYTMCNRILREKLGIPISMVSFGPTAHDKIVKEST